MIRSKILGCDRFQVISARPVAPLAADRAIRRLGACAGQDRVRIGVVALNAVAHVIDGDGTCPGKERAAGPAAGLGPCVTSQPTRSGYNESRYSRDRPSSSWPTRVMPRSPEPKA